MAGPGKTSPVGTITSPSDDQILVTLKYITPDQQKAARQQQAAEVKAGQKERAIGEILQEQTKNSTNPITKKELDLSDEVRHKVFWDRIPEAGAPKAKKPSIDESIRAAAKSLHIPEGKAVQSTGEINTDKRAESGRGWDPEFLLSKAVNRSKEANVPVERVDRQG